jgi:hypothetical protein
VLPLTWECADVSRRTRMPTPPASRVASQKPLLLVQRLRKAPVRSPGREASRVALCSCSHKLSTMPSVEKIFEPTWSLAPP